jgi:hypothetical protein
MQVNKLGTSGRENGARLCQARMPTTAFERQGNRVSTRRFERLV